MQLVGKYSSKTVPSGKSYKNLNVITIKSAIPFGIYIVVIHATHKRWPIYKVSKTEKKASVHL